MENYNEEVTFLIDNIKNSGVASIAYWKIVFTNKAVYFCDMGSNFLPGAYGAVADIFMTKKSKNLDINVILSKAKKYYRFQGEQLKFIEFKKGLFGGSLILNLGDDRRKVKVGGKNFDSFLLNLKSLK